MVPSGVGAGAVRAAKASKCSFVMPFEWARELDDRLEGAGEDLRERFIVPVDLAVLAVAVEWVDEDRAFSVRV